MAMKWQVVSQRQTERLTPNGSFQQVVQVGFQLESGTTGQIEVPANLYTAEYVRDKVDEVATKMIAVENLSA